MFILRSFWLSLRLLSHSPAFTGLSEAPLHPRKFDMVQKRKRTSIARVASETAVVQTEVATELSATVEPTNPPRRKKVTKRNPRTAIVNEDSTVNKAEDNADQELATPKKRRRTKNVEPVVYEIPPVERKITDFKGESGVTMG